MSVTELGTSAGTLASAVQAALGDDPAWLLRPAPGCSGVELTCGPPPHGGVVAAAITADASAGAVVNYARMRADQLCVPLRLVHVWTGARRMVGGVPMCGDLFPDADLLLASALHDMLTPAEAARAERQILHDEDPAAALRALSTDVGLLVVAAAGRPLTAARPLGRTSRALIGRTGCALTVLLPSVGRRTGPGAPVAR